MYKRNSQGWLKHIDFILWDVVALQLAFIVAYLIRMSGAIPYASEQYRILAIMFVVVDILIAAIFNTMHNVMKRGPYQEFVQSLKQVVLVLAVMSLYMLSVKSGDAFSRITIYLTAGFHLVFGYLIRMAWKPAVRRIVKDKPKPTLTLVAEEERIPEIIEKSSAANDFEIKGIVLSDRDAAGEEIFGKTVVANLADAADYICREWVDEVFNIPVSFVRFRSGFRWSERITGDDSHRAVPADVYPDTYPASGVKYRRQELC